MNVVINIQVCTYKWGNSIDLGGAPVSMLNFYNSYYATRNLVDNPINKNTKNPKQNKGKYITNGKSKITCHHVFGQCSDPFSGLEPKLMNLDVFMCSHIAQGVQKASLSSLNLFIKVICKVTISFSGIHKVRKFY